ncbi:hypothetical protein [Brasilonema sp. UFV-L1]|uniref:hypothetical protein n=1 Tax=Brasilonema sp. UFV-L1 TaxID=2234130 RepID=UPI00145E8AA5|nr:hypothetical protein [Brasilonema sp. UFV-L1]NMG11327.1 hypothetical protein [Brasilonema sp. UFV-L1]
MEVNDFMKRLSTVGRWMATAVLCVLAIAFVWQGAFFSKTTAMAAPAANLIADTDIASEVQGKVSKDAGRAKSFIRDTADKVEQTANKNANRVERATDDNGSFVERKANRDAARIERRAEEDAARTQKAVDNTKNVVERAVDNIKDTFSK